MIEIETFDDNVADFRPQEINQGKDGSQYRQDDWEGFDALLVWFLLGGLVGFGYFVKY